MLAFDISDTTRADSYPTRTIAAPSRTERLDPVTHRAWSPLSPLTREQWQAYERDGFVVLRGLFSASEIAALQAESQRMRTSPSLLETQTIVTEPGENDSVRTIFALHRQSALFARLAADARIAGLAQWLLADAVYVHQSRLNYKPGFTAKEFYWHSDFETWHAEDGMPRMRALSISILLTRNTPNNGPLMLIPGSHRTFVGCVGETPDDNFKSSLKRQTVGTPDNDTLEDMTREGGVVAATGPPGTLIVFDCNTVHGSNGNITPLPRSNAFFVFNAMSNRLEAPFAAPAPRPDFLAARDTVAAVDPVDGSLAA